MTMAIVRGAIGAIILLIPNPIRSVEHRRRASTGSAFGWFDASSSPSVWIGCRRPGGSAEYGVTQPRRALLENSLNPKRDNAQNAGRHNG
jgi:hypothetical protein